MITRLLTFVVLAATLLIAGCAGGLRVGTDRHGVGAGAAIVPQPHQPAR